MAAREKNLDGFQLCPLNHSPTMTVVPAHMVAAWPSLVRHAVQNAGSPILTCQSIQVHAVGRATVPGLPRGLTALVHEIQGHGIDRTSP